MKKLDSIVVMNDEAHHIHEDNAWKKSIEDIHNNLIQNGSAPTSNRCDSNTKT